MKKNDSSEARVDLERELEKGASVDEIRKKISEGEIKSKVSKQVERKIYSNEERIQRKKRDLIQIINKNTSQPIEIMRTKEPKEPKASSPVELYAKEIEEKEDSIIKIKKFSLGEKEHVVLAAKSSGKTQVYLGTDFNEVVTLHWALSGKPGKWLVGYLG